MQILRQVLQRDFQFKPTREKSSRRLQLSGGEEPHLRGMRVKFP